jgi:hypothetical protein
MNRTVIGVNAALLALVIANLVLLNVRSFRGAAPAPLPAPGPAPVGNPALIPPQALDVQSTLGSVAFDYRIRDYNQEGYVFVPFETPDPARRTLSFPSWETADLHLGKDAHGRTCAWALEREWHLLSSLERVTRHESNRNAAVRYRPGVPQADIDRAVALLKDLGFGTVDVRGEAVPYKPAIHVDTQLIGEPPFKDPVLLPEGTYKVRAMREVWSGNGNYPPAPFVVREFDLKVAAGLSQTLEIREPDNSSHGETRLPAARMALAYTLKNKSVAERQEAFDSAKSGVGEWRHRMAELVDAARYDPLVQQITAYYDAFLRSSPSRPWVLFRGVPYKGEGQSERRQGDFELRGEDVKHLVRWLVMHYWLLFIEGEVRWMKFDEWQQAMRDIGDQDRMTAAWKIDNEITALAAEAKQLRVSLERTAANLAELLESARPR